MNRIFLAAVLLCACGGSGGGGNDAAVFVGTWTGTTTVTFGGQVGSSSSFTHITGSGSSLTIGDVCANGSGPSATTNGPTSFTVNGITCPPGTLGTCSSANITISGGSGQLSGATLTISASGTVSACGSTAPITFSFVGHKVAATPS